MRCEWSTWLRSEAASCSADVIGSARLVRWRSEPCRLEGMIGTAVAVLRVRPHDSEITTQRLQRKSLGVDLAHGSKAQLAEDRNWRAPALDGMLKQKGGDESRKSKPSPIHRRAEGHARE